MAGEHNVAHYPSVRPSYQTGPDRTGPPIFCPSAHLDRTGFGGLHIYKLTHGVMLAQKQMTVLLDHL